MIFLSTPRFFKCLVVAAFVIVVLTTPEAKADFTYTVTAQEGLITKTATFDLTTGTQLSNNFGGLSGFSVNPDGTVEFDATGAVTVGDYRLNISQATTNSPGAGGDSFLDVTSYSAQTFATNPSAPLVVTLTVQGYTDPGAASVYDTSSLGAITFSSGTPASAAVSYASYLNGSLVNSMTVTNVISSPNPPATQVVVVNNSVPFTMQEVFTFSNMGSNHKITGTFSTNDVTASPAPSSAALALAGLPFLGLAGWYRRRRTVTHEPVAA